MTDIFSAKSRRIDLDKLPEFRREAPTPADAIILQIDEVTRRAQALFDLLGGMATMEQCAVLADLESKGVIEDLRADGTVARGPNAERYAAQRKR